MVETEGTMRGQLGVTQDRKRQASVLLSLAETTMALMSCVSLGTGLSLSSTAPLVRILPVLLFME